MKARKKADAVATIGKYTDKQGKEQKRYTNVGTLFEGEEGRLSLKLDSIPVGPEWSGWISFFAPKESNQTQSRTESKQSVTTKEPDENDEIPF